MQTQIQIKWKHYLNKPEIGKNKDKDCIEVVVHIMSYQNQTCVYLKPGVKMDGMVQGWPNNIYTHL